MDRLTRHLRNSPLLIAYVVMALGFAGAGAGYVHGEAIEDFNRCEDSQAGRTVLRDVVVAATEPGQGFQLTSVPGFDALDPETQQYFRNLEAMSRAAAEAGVTDSTRERLLALVPIPECEPPGWFG